MDTKVLKVYIENSVIGGYFDDEFSEPTKMLFELFRQGLYKPVISGHVITELDDGAPEHVKDILITINYSEYDVTEEMEMLAQKYIDAKILTENYSDDALHIAVATIVEVDLLVSWNFKHIVNYNRIQQFNATNVREGYKPLEIRTPKELILL